MNPTILAHPRATKADTDRYQRFSMFVERKIKGSKNKTHARSVLWVAKLNREYLGGV